MAAGPVDVRGMAARALVERLAKTQGGAAGGAGTPDAAGAQLSQQFSELRGADPQMMTKAVEQMKQMALAVLTRTAFQVPEASRHMAQALKSFDGALKALQQASATVNTVAPPIMNNAGMSPNQPETQQPQPGSVGSM